MAFPVGSSARTSPFFVMWFIFALLLVFQRLSSLWSKKRHLTGWIGVSSIPLLSPWVLALHSSNGSCCSTLMSRALSMLMATSLPFFSLSRGARQGCPLSPLLYVLVAEVLACSIRANPHFDGLSLPSFLSPLRCISQYADDTSLVSDRAINEVFDVYDLYERGSGAKLNLSKCEGLWLGSWNGRTDAPVDISWTSVKIKLLGVFLGPGNLDEMNWRPCITAVENVLNSWRQHSLSFHGRALVINALALSRVWYVASLIPVPPWVISELNSLVFMFF